MTDPPSEDVRLLGYVKLSRGHFSLTLARYADERVARPAWEELLADLRNDGCTITLVDFSGAPADTPIMARLQHAAKGADGLFVVGLEELLVSPDERPRATRAVATFNFNRDLLRARVPVPVVLWLSDEATRALAQLAPDTFDVLRTTFEFPEFGPEVEVDATVRRPPWLEPVPVEERDALELRRRALASLLVDTEPESAEAGDLAASLAMTLFALDQREAGSDMLERASHAHEQAGSLGAAATALRQRAQWSITKDNLDQATRLLARAQTLAERSIRSDDPLKLLKRRMDIIEAKTALASAQADVRARARDSEFELLERWQAGDKQAGNELVTRYFAPLRAYFRIRVPDDAEDFIQETFSRIFAAALDSIVHRSSFRAYLFGLARLVFMEYLRARYPKERASTLKPTTHFNSLSEERFQLIEFLEALPIADRELMELRYFDGLGINELATIFEVSPSTIRARVHRVRNQLRKNAL